MKRWFFRLAVMLLAAAFVALPGHAQGQGSDAPPATQVAPVKKKRFGDSRDRVELSIALSAESARPGDRLVAAIVLGHQKGWHSHTNDPKVPAALGKPENYIKTQLKLDSKNTSLTDGRGAGPIRAHMTLIQWPPVHETSVTFAGEAVKYGVFDGRAVIFVPVTVDAKAAEGEYDVSFLVTFQSCDENSCIAPANNVRVAGKLRIARDSPPAQVIKEGDFSSFDDTVFSRVDASGKSADAGAGNSNDPAAKTTAVGATKSDSTVRFAFFGLDFSVDSTGFIGGLLMIVLALLGGFLLNFTPCVLPVIPIKMISLSRAAGDRLRCLWLGTVMSIGVVVFWLGLGIAIAVSASFLSGAGKSGGITSSNELFQHPPFTIAVGVVIAVMAVGMCGLFAVRLPQFVYNYSPKSDSVAGAIGMGIMTAVLSTPCTAPFMGTAAAWAVGLGPTRTLAIFAAIGVGMALPYFLLSAFPAVASRMPRTGPSSELIKQVMGLLMLAAGAYFIGTGVSGALAEPGEAPTRVYWWFVAAFVIAAGVWLAWRTFQISRSMVIRATWSVVSLAMIAGSINLAIAATEKGPTQWVYYTPERYDAVLKRGKVVVMDFTAEWCINCKVLEKSVLDTKRVSSLFDSGEVVPMKVDLTGNNDAGNDKLREVDGIAIPLLVVFDKNGKIVFKSDAYTADEVVKAVNSALASH